MKNFTSVNDVSNVPDLVDQAIEIKKNPINLSIGSGKTLGLLFFNPSLRTRLSSQKAAYNLGMNVITLNVDKEGWKIEFEDGAIMDQGSQEHIRDAVEVISQYCDILGVRTFAGLQNREEDYQEKVLSSFITHATVPVVSLESATLHPLQSLADLVTIREQGIVRPKVVVSWAPHPRALPQAVVNSFLEWITKTDTQVVLTHPEGYELSEKYTQDVAINKNQDQALQGADFVYVKNWSAYEPYGKKISADSSWTITKEKMALTNHGRFMHCLPIRRNVIATDAVINESLVIKQAENRVYSAQTVFKTLLEAQHEVIESH
ncbi:N-acetylornithine carbamoyltransferase [Fulvivirgaceae bacterium BMA12]|uniref:N-succinylornithine carbamoyltransferase n=1 Tax=Agaribacillus aureus TaxID=3051825 RepID=A0ABT8LC77_9BACT|nr:N-acetylornithine carbamoyltransferase [Fulvivirgaceae bacterium BMA12]